MSMDSMGKLVQTITQKTLEPTLEPVACAADPDPPVKPEYA